MRKRILGVLVLLGIVIILILIAWSWISASFEQDYEFTLGYVCFQIIVGGVAVGVLWQRKYWYIHTNTVASILTVIGVLGTFIGIYIGLQEFNPNPKELENSIKGLLDGLKIAFLTSIVGIASALVLKGIISPLAQEFQKGINPSEEAIKEFVTTLTKTLESVQTSGETNLLAQLVTLNTTIETEGSETRKVLDNVKTELVGIHASLTEDEGTTLKQLQILTTTISSKYNELISFVIGIKDALIGENENTVFGQLTELAGKHDELIRLQAENSRKTLEILGTMRTDVTGIKGALIGEDENTVFGQLQELTSTVSEKIGEIAAKVGEIATGQLIEALREVIRDFNKNLTEQFGENFKQLNEAVGKTIEWQKQYGQQMRELAEEFRIAAQSIEQSRESVKQIAEASGEIAENSCSIVACAEDMEPLLHTLNDQLKAFSELRQKAHDAFPLIERRLDDLTVNFSAVVKTAITDSHTSMETQRTALATQVDQLQRSTNETNQRVTELTTILSNTIKTSIAASQTSMDQQREALTDQLQQLQTTMIASNRRVHQTINYIREHLDSVFERSADHIAQVTTDFTQNLTQQMENILENQARELSNIVERNKEEIENHVNILHNALRKAVNTLDESLEKELNTSLRNLAGYFKELSSGFVDNYEQLTTEHNRLIKEHRQLINAIRRAL